MNAIATPRASYRPLSGFANILRSEFCKLRSVRSTYWTLFAAVAFNVGLAGLEAIILPGHLSAHDKATLDATRVSLGGIHLSQIAFGVLGVLVITGEYGTGMIRATLSAVPQRRLVLAAKALVFTVVGLVIGIVASFGAYFTFQAFLSGDSLRSSIGEPGVLRAVIGGGLYMTVLGLFGLGLGAIIRVSAGAIAVLFGVLFVPQILVQLLPQSWQSAIGPYVPMEAANQIFSAHQEAGNLGAWAGFGVFCVYAVVALVAGFFVISRRDA
ncbi:MAG: ABC transporter permease subunit [Candidatus Dormibacteraeota bacterium]|uniref:ABC transporter permease n=1 Tax=Candidatus Aeolococcus gillhamiae TaxID=3127015 RepID=A0A2W5ZJR7_9BACT|nr:ABC transporter permease subunit [Candidatus Dormibacteraeota bacterium]PZR83275.1 MAG: ABC transporter permease [Candidatus Dormibacter sp. RRmetagenome_bin12]